MFSSTSLSSIPQEIITSVHYSRRLLLHSPFHPSPPTIEAPTPTYQVLDPNSSHANPGFDANIVMILAVLICALICSFCINAIIRFVIKYSSMIIGESNYHLNHDQKKKCNGLDKRALKTFPVVKYSTEVEIQGLGTECVICLSEFKGGEKVRILPKCHHGFHVKCIDKWLGSNSSCPTCRQSLVETCNKIIGCGDDHQTTSSSESSSLSTTTTTTTTTSTSDMVVVSIVPLEREDLVRDYRSEVAQS
ncbi:RING-H2 finger protein ATL78-like [Chenopodium quinoa]|uniref:RING-H2 finger protein ATL78-like n=1 Tax=Chenopodium quinoa TaxID=63459 RepID=UPI000B77D652|nr:RING-H2 finger protein ATL78-like [Chenopodium quinoa]